MVPFKTAPVTMVDLVTSGAIGVAMGVAIWVAIAELGGQLSRRGVVAALAARISADQAIAVAEQKMGGRAMTIAVQLQGDVCLYEVKTVAQDKVTEVFIDADSARVVNIENEVLIAKVLDWEDRWEFAKLADSSTTLAVAVAMAEQYSGGRAIEASFDEEDGATFFTVEVAKDNTIHSVFVDSVSGKVLHRWDSNIFTDIDKLL